MFLSESLFDLASGFLITSAPTELTPTERFVTSLVDKVLETRRFKRRKWFIFMNNTKLAVNQGGIKDVLDSMADITFKTSLSSTLEGFDIYISTK